MFNQYLRAGMLDGFSFRTVRESAYFSQGDVDAPFLAKPSIPVRHIQGTPEKVAEMRRRVFYGQEIFAPGDGPDAN